MRGRDNPSPRLCRSISVAHKHSSSSGCRYPILHPLSRRGTITSSSSARRIAGPLDIPAIGASHVARRASASPSVGWHSMAWASARARPRSTALFGGLISHRGPRVVVARPRASLRISSPQSTDSQSWARKRRWRSRAATWRRPARYVCGSARTPSMVACWPLIACWTACVTSSTACGAD